MTAAQPRRVNPGSSLAALLDTPIRPGRLIWIGLRPGRREAMEIVETAILDEDRGLAGDRYGRAGGARQVTLIAAEALAAIASHLGRPAVAPEMLRRNLVTAGVNLAALKGRRFEIGGAELETTGECHPCSRMEEALGQGGYNAVRGLGGLTARVIRGGPIRIGDPIERLAPLDAPAV
jgi:MOSC domain-containing protein YiiM